MSFRTQGIEALATVLNNNKNITILEKTVYEIASKLPFAEEEYKQGIYQVLADVQEQISIKIIYRNIKNGNIGWKHKCFDDMARMISEQNEFIENPFEVEEGVHTCMKCGSKRVFSYNRQVRGGDEGTGVFCECAACHCKWQERG
mgnify:CR=1 FL=1